MIWLKRYGTDLVGSYTDAIRAIGALPWLFAALIALELGQHIIEVRTGFFESYEISRALQEDSGRMLLGWAKMLSIYVGAFFVLRHLGGRANAPIVVAARRFLPYTVYALVVFALIFYAPKWVAPHAVMGVRSAIGLTQVFVEPLLMLWFVSAATDGAVRTPWDSARKLSWFYAYAMPLFFVARLPPYALHRALNLAAMGKPAAQLWTILVLDAAVVALIIAVIPAIAVRVARRWVARTQPAPAGLALA